jgi:hypothetical protein
MAQGDRQWGSCMRASSSGVVRPAASRRAAQHATF